MVSALTLLVGGHAAFGQGRGGGGGVLVFTTRRPPREMVGNIRGWANSNHATSYGEDTQSHVWRVNFMAFLARAPNTAEVTLAWFHIEANRQRTFVPNSSEPISLSNPTDRIFFHSTALHRQAGEFEPMERYEAVLSANDARGQHEIARGQIGLAGQVEHHSGVVDFTGAAPTTR
ncbi:MAG: hypothetical protein WCJ30_20545 [Deltaproteobacteria bacterium]